MNLTKHLVKTELINFIGLREGGRGFVLLWTLRATQVLILFFITFMCFKITMKGGGISVGQNFPDEEKKMYSEIIIS